MQFGKGLLTGSWVPALQLITNTVWLPPNLERGRWRKRLLRLSSFPTVHVGVKVWSREAHLGLSLQSLQALLNHSELILQLIQVAAWRKRHSYLPAANPICVTLSKSLIPACPVALIALCPSLALSTIPNGEDGFAGEDVQELQPWDNTTGTNHAPVS